MNDDVTLDAIVDVLPDTEALVVVDAVLERDDTGHVLRLPSSATPETGDRVRNFLQLRGFESVSVRVDNSRSLSADHVDEARSDLVDPESEAEPKAEPELDSGQESEAKFEEDCEPSPEPVVSDTRSNAERSAQAAVDRAQHHVSGLAERRRALLVDLRLAELEAGRDERVVTRLEGQIEGLQVSRDSLELWIAQRRHSFAWRFLGALRGERDSAVKDAREAEATINRGRRELDRLLLPQYSPPHFMPKVFVSLGVILGLVLLAQFLRARTRFFGEIYVPSFWPMLGFALLVFTGIFISIWLSTERAYISKKLVEAHEERKKTGRFGLDDGQHTLMRIVLASRVLTPIPILITVVMLIRYLASVLPIFLSRYIPTALWLWIGALFLWIALVLIAWFRYYKALDHLRGVLLRAAAQAERSRKIYVHSSREISRLDAMHAMVPEYLELLARVMHRPWIVDTSLLNQGGTDVPADAFPASVSLAVATRDVGTAGNRLHRKSLELAFQPGWLTAAFDDLLEKVADFEGSSARRVDFEAIAGDPGDSRNGPRRRTLEAIQREEVLRAVGRTQLPILADAIQRRGIREIKPLVRPLRSTGLDGVEVSGSRFLHEYAGHVQWDAFLEGALTPAAPFSLLAFDDGGLSTRPTRVHSSNALVPAKLASQLTFTGIKVTAKHETAGSPLDAVVRIDRSDWMEPKLLKIFSGVVIVPDERVDKTDHVAAFAPEE